MTQNAIRIGTQLWRVIRHGVARRGYHHRLLHRLRCLAIGSRGLRIRGRILLEGINVAEAAIHEVRFAGHMRCPHNGILVDLNGFGCGACVRQEGLVVEGLHLDSTEDNMDVLITNLNEKQLYPPLFFVCTNGRSGGQNIVGILAWHEQRIL